MVTLTIEAPRIHIYPFSRLVGAAAPKWERMLTELEEKEKIVFLYYQPMREAAVRLTSEGGAGRDDLFVKMCEAAQKVVHSPTQNPVTDNQKRFLSFEKHFFPKIKAFETSLLKSPQVEGTFFSGVILKACRTWWYATETTENGSCICIHQAGRVTS